MKLYAVIVGIILINCVLAGRFKLSDRGKIVFQECFKQENLSDEEIARIRNRDTVNPSPKMKCFSACFFERAGYVKDGILQENLILERLVPKYGEEKVKIGIEKCKKVKGDDRCDLGMKLFDCFENVKKDLLY